MYYSQLWTPKLKRVSCGSAHQHDARIERDVGHGQYRIVLNKYDSDFGRGYPQGERNEALGVLPEAVIFHHAEQHRIDVGELWPTDDTVARW